MNSFPPIEELLPHRGTMLLLDRVAEFDGGGVVAEYSPRQGAWYADGAGNMPAWLGIELMAQAVAVHVALKKRQAGFAPRMGALLGTRRYQATVRSFFAGKALQVCAQEVFRDETGLAAYDCSIRQHGEILATSTLKVYEPDDFESFMQGNTL